MVMQPRTPRSDSAGASAEGGPGTTRPAGRTRAVLRGPRQRPAILARRPAITIRARSLAHAIGARANRSCPWTPSRSPN